VIIYIRSFYGGNYTHIVRILILGGKRLKSRK
jgi:hypothetical protein